MLAALASVLLTAGAAQAAARKSAVLVVDGNTGRVLHHSAADELRYPASLTKMMTLYLVFEGIEQGRLSYQTRIKFSANAAATPPSKLDLAEGEEMLLLDAVKILITKSANDVAIAVAEHIAGSEERFARLMTQKARQIGMAATTFRNASGLPDPSQLTTARDMITLALRLQDDFPRHYPLFATRAATYKGEEFRNHNTMLGSYEGTDGLKTGYTRASGFNLVASVRRGKKHVVGVVFGGASAEARNTAMRTFLNMGLVKASNERTRQPAAVLVARAPRPAPERRIAAVPQPEHVARPPVRAVTAPAPTPAAASPRPAEAPALETAPQTAPQAAPAPAPPIAIARVRTVLVTPRPAGANAGGAPPAEPAKPTPQADAGPRPAAREPPEPAAPTMRSWATAAALAPRTTPAAAEQPLPPVTEAPAPPARGAAPSTLEQQAANLARGAPAQPPPPAAWPPAVPQPSPVTAALPTPARGPFQIQIGAFLSQAEAERRLAAAREHAGALLARGAPVTQPVQQGDKKLYRARYSGLDSASANKACSELKRHKIDCLVMKAE